MAMLTSLLGATVAVWYTLLGGPRHLAVEEVPVALPGWPAEAAPARVVLLADLHVTQHDAAWVDEQVQVALAQKPECIILLGDYIKNSEKEHNMPAAELARRLAPLLEAGPVYYVRGNHDISRLGFKLKKEFDARGFICVESQDIPLQFANGCKALLRGSSFRCDGTSPGNMNRRFSAQNLPGDMPLLVAVHSPYHFLHFDLKADFVMCGHTHGGMVCWPGGYPVFSSGIWSREYLRGGLHSGKAAGQQIYVTRGTGTSSVPIRLGCRPELTLLLLSGSGTPLPRP